MSAPRRRAEQPDGLAARLTAAASALAALTSAVAALAVGAATREGWAAAVAATAAPLALAAFQSVRAPGARKPPPGDEARGAWPWFRRGAGKPSFEDALVGVTPSILAKVATRAAPVVKGPEFTREFILRYSKLLKVAAAAKAAEKP